jgi:hypothetical protein
MWNSRIYLELKKHAESRQWLTTRCGFEEITNLQDTISRESYDFTENSDEDTESTINLLKARPDL